MTAPHLTFAGRWINLGNAPWEVSYPQDRPPSGTGLLNYQDSTTELRTIPYLGLIPVNDEGLIEGIPGTPDADCYGLTGTCPDHLYGATFALTYKLGAGGGLVDWEAYFDAHYNVLLEQAATTTQAGRNK